MYKVENIGEAELESRMNILAAEGWTLVSCLIHGLVTDEGHPLFVTIWSR